MKNNLDIAEIRSNLGLTQAELAELMCHFLSFLYVLSYQIHLRLGNTFARNVKVTLV